jgi:DNA-binding transcriptional MerR regulator
MSTYGFVATQVAKLLNIPYATLDSWIRNEMFIPSLANASGRGSKRLLSFHDVVVLKIIAHLRNQGIHNDLLVYLIQNLKARQSMIGTRNYEQILVSNGEDLFEFVQDKVSLIDFFTTGKPVWAIPIGRVVESVKDDIRLRRIDKVYINEDAKVKVG